MTSPSHAQIAPASDEFIERFDYLTNLRFVGVETTSNSTPIMMSYGDIRSLIARIKAERDASEVLKAALEPFAKAGRGVGTVWADEFPVDSSRMGALLYNLTVGDFRNASRALLSPQRNEP